MKLCSRTPSTFSKENTLLPILFVLSFTLRTLVMSCRDLDLDEAFSLSLVGNFGILDLISPFSPVITADAHPPFYYFVIYCWVNSAYISNLDILGSPELAFRLPFAIIGTVTTFIMYRIGAIQGGPRFGFLIALIHAISSFAIQISHQARMYPIVEMLAAWMLYECLILIHAWFWKHAIRISLCSSLLLLTHYNTAFFLSIVWGTLLWVHRKSWKAPVMAACISAAGFAWWLPALWSQFSREAASSSTAGSTGIIIPLTLLHFLTGDRSVLLGPFPHLFYMISSLVLFFLFGIFLLFLFQNGFSRYPDLKYILVLSLAPIFLNWMATFYVHRAFNGSHYAIYSLPAFLLLVAAAILFGARINFFLAFAAFSLIIFANGASLIRYYSNTLTPYEPWNEACRFLESKRPEKVFIYPPYMSVLVEFYGPYLPLIKLPASPDETSDLQIRQVICGNGRSGKIFLVLSHDKGEGCKYKRLFGSCFDPGPIMSKFYNIRILEFGPLK